MKLPTIPPGLKGENRKKPPALGTNQFAVFHLSVGG